jgi:hypothetical protein
MHQLNNLKKWAKCPKILEKIVCYFFKLFNLVGLVFVLRECHESGVFGHAESLIISNCRAFVVVIKATVCLAGRVGRLRPATIDKSLSPSYCGTPPLLFAPTA